MIDIGNGRSYIYICATNESVAFWRFNQQARVHLHQFWNIRQGITLLAGSRFAHQENVSLVVTEQDNGLLNSWLVG